MHKITKFLTLGALLGGAGYLAFTEKGNEYRLTMAARTKHIRDVLELGYGILEADYPEGLDRQTQIGLITALYKELPTMDTNEEVLRVRAYLSTLARVDERWKWAADIYRTGVVNLEAPQS